jgi:hypothetical protein
LPAPVFREAAVTISQQPEIESLLKDPLLDDLPDNDDES